MFLPVCGNPERDDQAVLADVDAVDQQRDQVEAVEGRGLPRLQLRGGPRDEAPTDAALARAATRDVRGERIQAPRVLPRRHADQQLLEDSGWCDALVLVQPVTVWSRWHRDRFVRRWWRRSRRPGRPRIDSPCRDLIRRLAEENRLWGAPRIHGELLKLGVVVSERTVSRYLRERPKRPSQTWRTFIANHLGQFEFNIQMLSPYVSGDDVVDASPSTCRPISSDRLPASRQCALLDGHASARRPCLGLIILHSGSPPRPSRHAKECRPGPPEGLDCCSQRTAGAVQVESFRSNRANGNR